MVKRIMLTMADELYLALEKKKSAHGFMTVQEIINDIIRSDLVPMQRREAVKLSTKDGSTSNSKTSKKGKVGRPKKEDEPFLNYFSRK